MTELAYSRSGEGAALVLLHGIGSSQHMWAPVVPLLEGQFDVIRVDLPGFGKSAPLPTGVEPGPAALAAAVAGLLDDLGIPAPNVVGNSLGGWVALELAQMRSVASLTLLSPAGLWRTRTPRYNLVSLRLSRWLARYTGWLLLPLMRFRVARFVVLKQTHGRPTGMTPEHARATVRAIGTAPDFDAALRATARRGYLAGIPIDAPITVAFGSRDRLLLRKSRRLDQLPADTQVAHLPGCGHVPTTDDPHAVAAVIRLATRSTARSSTPVRSLVR